MQLGDDFNWVVKAFFDAKLKMSPEGVLVQQILLNDDGTALLARNGPLVTVWPMEQTSSSFDRSNSMTACDTAWNRHPTDSALLLSFNTSSFKLYRWDDI